MPSLGTPPTNDPLVERNGMPTRTFQRWLSDAWRTIVPARQMYIPVSSGAPTFTPEARPGLVALCYDATGNRVYVYNGAWKSVTLT